jgi:hypothetical protein
MTDPRIRRTGRRRVVTDPAPGSDPTPQSSADAVRASEDTDAAWGAADRGARGHDNDERLRQDVPPHWHSSV